MKKFGIVILAIMTLFLSACGFKAAESGEVGIVQNGSLFPGADKNLIGCIAPETTENRLFDEVFYYPARQISWDATGGTGAERNPYIVTSNREAPAELTVPVVVTMDLTSDCALLQEFHRNQGTKYRAWMQDVDGTRATNEGWVSLLNYAVGQPTEVELVKLAQKYPWQEIWNDEAVRAEFQQTLRDNLPKAIEDRLGGAYFDNLQVTVTKPDPVNDELKAAIATEQTAIAAANSKRETADANIEVAKSETKVAEEQAKQKAAEIAGYPSVEDYLMAQLIAKGGNPYQPVIVPGMPK